jgi:ferric-dicitrate binding protein FerR (iron transport regulator)
MMDEALFQRLCQAHIEGMATEDEQSQLAAILDGDEEARRAYVEQMRVHALLSWQHGRVAAVGSGGVPERKVVFFPRWQWMAIAAGMLLLCGLAAWWQQAQSSAGVRFDVVTAADTPFRVGDRVTRHVLEMERGRMSFRLTSGALVEVAGPAEVELISSMHLRVLRGTLTADISEGTKGFVVETAETRVVDLGTRFSVAAGTSAGTDVVVFEGKVEVSDPATRLNSSSAKITLRGGDAIRVDPERQTKRLPMVPLGADAQTLKGGAQSDIVSGVHDNVSEQGYHRYYGLVRGAMGEGARVYTTGHDRTWHPMPGTSFPAELQGADGICTFDTDRYEKALQITLQITRPCYLYVMTDARQPAPDWLKAEFSDTGYRLRSGPWIPRGAKPDQLAGLYKDENSYFTHIVWRKHVTQAGAITLGSPQSEEQKGSPIMYSLAVKAL